ncbi:MAG: flagellar export chaperone FlgN [Planctomycetota bacterium]|jgi:hypothetical protein
MKTVTFEIEGRIDELLVVLDKDIQHMQDSLSRLNELRSLVVKRNEADLGKLLESIQTDSDSYRSHELKRESIRKELANALGCDLKQMTLSRLETVVSEEQKAQVAAKKARLRALTKQLKKEHLSTAMLLSDCARFNSQLLSSVFNLGKVGIVCYDSKGSAKRGVTEAFVNLQF